MRTCMRMLMQAIQNFFSWFAIASVSHNDKVVIYCVAKVIYRKYSLFVWQVIYREYSLFVWQVIYREYSRSDVTIQKFPVAATIPHPLIPHTRQRTQQNVCACTCTNARTQVANMRRSLGLELGQPISTEAAKDIAATSQVARTRTVRTHMLTCARTPHTRSCVHAYMYRPTHACARTRVHAYACTCAM